MSLSDLLRPRWKQSNADVRLAAVREMSPKDSEMLIEIAASDEDARVRLEAVTRLRDQLSLETLAAQASDREVLAVVTQKLNQIWRETVLHSAQADACRALLGRISDQSILAEIAVAAEDELVRVGAVERISDMTVLCRITQQNCGRVAGLAVVDRIDAVELLQRIVANASNKGVRRKAEEKLAAIEVERNRPSAGEQRNEELRELFDEAARLADSWNCDFVKARLGEIRSRWDSLDGNHVHPLHADLVQLEGAFAERYLQFLERQSEARARSEAREEHRAERETLCSRLEELSGQFGDDAEAEVAAIADTWALAPDLPDNMLAPLTARFAEAMQGFREAAELAQAQAEADAAFAAHVAELQAAAERLLAPPDFATMPRSLKQLEQALKQLTPPDATAEARLEPVRQLVTQAGTLLAEHRATEKERQAAAAALLSDLCEQAEALNSAAYMPPAINRAKELRAEWQEITRVPLPPERQKPLTQRFETATENFFKRVRDHHQEQDLDRWANLTLKLDLCAAVETIKNEPDLDQLAQAIRDAQKRWKEIGPVPRAESDAAWQRFHEACEAGYARCKVHFEAQRQQRAENLVAKRKLIAEVEAFQDQIASDEAVERIKAIQAEWKAIGAVPRKALHDCNQRFHQLCNAFFEARRNHFAARRDERQANTQRKQTLCEQAEALQDSEDWQETPNALKKLQADWKDAGAADRKHEQQLWDRFRAACDKFFGRLEAHYQQLDDERAENYVAQEALCGELDVVLDDLAQGKSRREVARQLVDLQNRFRAIGPPPRAKQNEMRDRFSKRIDGFFAEQRKAYEALKSNRDANLSLRESLIDQADLLADSTAWQETTEQLKELQREWKTIGSVPKEQERETYERFRAACNRFFERRHEHYAGIEQERYDNLRKKEEICARVEAMAEVKTEEKSKSSGQVDLATELKIAFESNFIKASAADDERALWRTSLEEVRKLQERWDKIGPVPREFDRSIFARYRRAQDEFYALRPEDDRPKVSKDEMQQNLERKSRLCDEVEKLAASARPEEHVRDVKRCQGQWKKTGRVPSKKLADELGDRFFAAVDKVYAAARAKDEADPMRRG